MVTGLYDKYLPMDIYPTYLLKAILAGDIDKMENLGIYEVVEVFARSLFLCRSGLCDTRGFIEGGIGCCSRPGGFWRRRSKLLRYRFSRNIKLQCILYSFPYSNFLRAKETKMV